MTVRRALAQLACDQGMHHGLFLDKLLPTSDTERGGKAAGEHLAKAVELRSPAAYRHAFDRRRASLEATPWSDASALVIATAKARGRLVVGLGEESVLEVGIALDHTWGVPVLPASALKGLAAAAARHLVEDDAWRGDGESYRTLFGSTDEQGAVAFLDGWWEPKDRPLHLDVMTVHHAQYYMKGDVPPSDTDSPNPVSFVSATGVFQVAVEGPPDWCEAALELLKLGLDELGIGAKTNAGYGRMDLSWRSIDDERAAREERRRASLPLVERLPIVYADLLRQSLAKQGDWLMQEGRRSPSEVSDEEWRAAVRAVFADAIGDLRNRAAGGSSEAERVRRQLDGHAGTKPSKSDKSTFRKWKAEQERLQKELDKAKRQGEKALKNQAQVLDLLAWLDGSPSTD